ncbi:hypothetical protein EJB05_58015, partial [Eragrostis curvula]
MSSSPSSPPPCLFFYCSLARKGPSPALPSQFTRTCGGANCPAHPEQDHKLFDRLVHSQQPRELEPGEAYIAPELELASAAPCDWRQGTGEGKSNAEKKRLERTGKRKGERLYQLN